MRPGAPTQPDRSLRGVEVRQRDMAHLLILPERHTAVFCTTDILAAGAIQALYAAGLWVPENMKSPGYDNSLSAPDCRP